MSFTGVTACISYKDAGTMADWLVRTFGFVERSRWVDKDGAARQVEMYIGETELWFSGGKSVREREWVVVWVDDVDALYDRVGANGVEAEPPRKEDYGVYQFHVIDPEGTGWSFASRTGEPYHQAKSLEDGGWAEIPGKRA